MKVYFFNSPKRSGKDYVASHMSSNRIQVHTMKFAEPLYKTVQEMFALDPREWASLYENAKEEPSERLWGMSPREAMIWVSEDVMKPRFGNDYFGLLALERLKDLERRVPETLRDHMVVVWSDSGFFDEAVPVIDYVGHENCHHVMLHRDGSRFGDGDSRKYWGVQASEYGIPKSQIVIINNNGNVGDTVNKIIAGDTDGRVQR